MPTMKKGTPKLSPFAQMLRAKREKLAPGATLKEFCTARKLEAPLIDGMEHDRRTAPGTYGALYKLASGYGHGPNDRWTLELLDAALGKAPGRPKSVGDRKTANGGTRRSPPAGRPTGVARRAAPAPRGTRAARRR